MHKTILTFVAAMLIGVAATAQTNNAATSRPPADAHFVDETSMKVGMMEMLARFANYMTLNYEDAPQPNAEGERYGTFTSRSTWKANEDGVRTNADMGMVAAFLCKYGRGRVALPSTTSWERLEQMAIRSLVYAYSTHKSLRLAACEGGRYWGSVSAKDHQWESNLWAMSVAYTAFFMWDKLSAAQRQNIEKLLKAECNYELERTIPTGYKGDTKAEENGWDANVLAVTLGLFPNDELAPQWFDRLRRFAINAYSHPSDATDTTTIDPHYDKARVCDLYLGPNLYEDYTLQNHDYFHTSYQNVVIQELGEAALALKLFQRELHGRERWHTRALMHNNEAVQRQVLNWLALPDGELAMPNGNDWSLFLYDQITSYTTLATFLGDRDALMLENLAYMQISARQLTTPDGAWLLRSDIGQRRMGVEAHRVMMSWLMHDMNSTSAMVPTRWDNFRRRYGQAKIFKCQNIVRGFTRDRFATFSWAPGIRSYTGYIAPNSTTNNNLIVPFKANNTGNFIGWYTVDGHKTNAQPTSWHIDTRDSAWTTNGHLLCNDSTLSVSFAIYASPGNAVVYLDDVSARHDATITGRQGGLMAISTDEFTQPQRTLYWASADSSCAIEAVKTDGDSLITMPTGWVNIDGSVGIVNVGGQQMAFGHRADNNSIMTSKLYAAYDDQPLRVAKGEKVDARCIIYYNNVGAETTLRLAGETQSLRDELPEGWNGALVADPDGARYIVVANFSGDSIATLTNINTPAGAPVFETETEVSQHGSTTRIALGQGQMAAYPIRFYVKGRGVKAMANGNTLTLTAAKRCRVEVTDMWGQTREIKLKRGRKVRVGSGGTE